MKNKKKAHLPDPAMHNVIILTGEFIGEEGYCLGPTDGGLWAVTPNRSNRIIALRFDDEFGISVRVDRTPRT